MIDATQYLKNKKRLEKAEWVMEQGDKWNDPKYAKWKEEYSQILEQNLEFESFHKIDWAAGKKKPVKRKKKVDDKTV